MAFPRLESHDPTDISEDDRNAQKLRGENGEKKPNTDDFLRRAQTCLCITE